jgi:protein TonB
MLFTEAPAAPVNPPFESKLESPIAEVTDKTLEIAQQELRPVTESAAKADLAPESKPEIRPEPKPVAPPRPPVFSSLSAKDEEVEIPAWLRPLAQHSETAETPAAPSEATQLVSSEFAASTAQESDSVDLSTRSEVAVFGGQLLAGDSISETASASGSKKGLFVGLVAAAVLLAAGGAWYYRQTHAAAAPAPQPTHTSTAPVASEPNSVTNASTAPATPPRAVANASAPSNAANSAPTRTPTPSQAAPAPAPETRRSAETHNSAPLEEPTKKPSLGAVRLASPVVRGSGEGNASGEPLPSIDAHAESSSADPLADVAHHKAPAVPIPVGGDVKPAQLIKSVAPVYPPLAKTQRVTGNVTLDALIDVSGNVAQVKVISGPPLLHQAALEAVKQWKYTPAQLDGNPTSMHLTVTVQFRNQ